MKRIFQSTSPVWRTTDRAAGFVCTKNISIHVPRVEDDHSGNAHACAECYFNPRPPCGGRPATLTVSSRTFLFQSTSPVWRTTTAFAALQTEVENFNPRPPCGGRRDYVSVGILHLLISIHVPRVEDDVRGHYRHVGKEKFQSTSPVWRTTSVAKTALLRRTSFQSTSPVWRTTSQQGNKT